MQSFERLRRGVDEFAHIPARPIVRCGTCAAQLQDAAAIPQRRFSGVVNYSATLCPECRTGWEDFARIVCIGCQSLVAFLKPRREPCGFEYKRGSTYHVRHCPKCKPKDAQGRPIPGASVMEYEMYCRDQKVALRLNADLVQEIEQKSLQAEAEAAKVLASLAKSDVFTRKP